MSPTKRTPLITPNAEALLHQMLSHPDSPRWNYECGDQITKEDLDDLKRFRAELHTRRSPWNKARPPLFLLQKISAQLPYVPRYQSVDLSRWGDIPTTSRIDLARSPAELVPENEDTERMVIYTTSGTTGHPILVPSHPFTSSCYLVFLDLVLDLYRVKLDLRDDLVGCLLLCAQQKTIMYATPHTAWACSGFAKINLLPHDWPSPESIARYCSEFSPQVISGDPISFAQMLRQQLPIKPRTIVSTALALSDGLKQQLEACYQCPVIDWYSSNETGPLAYKCVEGFFHLLTHDVFVELLDQEGRAVNDGERGELTVSGGRNPFLPLLRYRTGDFARIERAPCGCKDLMPRLIDLEGRETVFLQDANGVQVNTVDVSRVLQRYPIIQHQLIQDENNEVSLTLHAMNKELQEPLRRELAALFGGLPIDIRFVDGFETKSGKVLPYRRTLE